MTVTTEIDGVARSVTVPRHRQLKVGTLGSIVNEVANQVGLSPTEVRYAPFNR